MVVLYFGFIILSFKLQLLNKWQNASVFCQRRSTIEGVKIFQHSPQVDLTIPKEIEIDNHCLPKNLARRGNARNSSTIFLNFSDILRLSVRTMTDSVQLIKYVFSTRTRTTKNN